MDSAWTAVAATLLGMYFAAPAAAQLACKGDVCSYHLNGPVHIQKIESQKLPDYSRLDPRILCWSPPASLVFDPNGSLIEIMNRARPPMTPTPRKLDNHGHLIEEENITDGKKTTWRYEYVYGPEGTQEIRMYRDGGFHLLTTIRYDGRGNIIETYTHDAFGKTLNRTVSRYDGQGHELEREIHGNENRFQTHIIDGYDREGGLASRDFLGADGRILLSLAFRQRRLVSLARDPECQVEPLSFSVGAGDRGISYDVKDHCRVEITVEEHPGRTENNEVDATERYDEAWNLLEKVTYHYERDRYGNWITRSLSAWDPETDALIPIQEDRREISYYE